MTAATTELAGRVAIVTGAGSDLGAASAIALAGAAASVVPNDRRAHRLQETADVITARGGTATLAPGDVAESVPWVSRLSSLGRSGAGSTCW